MSCNPPDPWQLWLDFKTELCSNDTVGCGPLTLEAECSALWDINAIVKESGLSLVDNFAFPADFVSQRITTDRKLILQEELSYDVGSLKQLHDTNWNLLNPEQRKIYDAVTVSAMNDGGQCFAVNAAGGCGKTFVMSTILAAIRMNSKVSVFCASFIPIIIFYSLFLIIVSP